MNGKDFSEVVDQIVKEDPRFEKGAYFFVRRALDHTLKSAKAGFTREGHHVSGGELLEGVREFALEQYGPMAKTLFDNWGIRETVNFGEIVFNLVEFGVFGKTDQDSLDDFRDIYDFEEAFVHPFEPENKALVKIPSACFEG